MLGCQLKPIDLNEMRSFMGRPVLLSSYLPGRKKPAQSLWNAEHGRPIFPATMTFQRFKTIIRFIRFDDKASRNERYRNDKFAPIREIFTFFQNNIEKLFYPFADICVDEQLLALRNRCPFIQYIPSKPGKFGIKFWVAADCQSHYVLRISPYLWKEPDRTCIRTVGEDVVMDLVGVLQQKWT